MLSRLASTAGTGEGRFVSPVVTSIAGAGLLMGVILLPTVASQAAINSSTWLAKAWQSDDGLPDNSVSGIAQTPDGYLWIGTLGGLARFDGATGGFSPHFETDKSESAAQPQPKMCPACDDFAVQEYKQP